jgi:hypothetical protein
MKRLHVRFTVRGMMAAVAVVAALLTAGLGVAPGVSRRWNACQAAARRQAQLAQMHAANATMNTGLARWSKAAAYQAARSRDEAALHREMSRRNWWAFFDPFHDCVLDSDIY